MLKKITTQSVMAVLCQKFRKRIVSKPPRKKDGFWPCGYFAMIVFLCLLFAIRSEAQTTLITLKGEVKNENGLAMPGVSVTVSENKQTEQTDQNGVFNLAVNLSKGKLIITYLGFKTQEVAFNENSKIFKITLVESIDDLDEVQIIGYGQTTKRLNTGNIGTIKAADIEKQPVSNPLSALQGRIAGLNITQSSGVAGSGFKVQIRGQNSLIQGSEPLFIIDGVPFSANNNALNQISSAAGSSTAGTGMSPLNLINPSDIESIDVLKDADATAIYGSRGANGVILITTKRAKAGPIQLNGNIYSGFSKISRSIEMLNTSQYLQMRREGFKNDGIVPTAANAPDLMLWDTTRYTNFNDLLIGGTAKTTDVQVNLSGGNEVTRFTLGGGYHAETTVYPTDLGDKRGSIRVGVDHSSSDKKFNLNFNGSYSSDRNKLTTSDLSSAVNTTPTLLLYDADGKLNWSEAGIVYSSLGILNPNPLAFQDQIYLGQFQNLNANINLRYSFSKQFAAKVNAGYNFIYADETAKFPSTSIDRFSNQLPYSNFASRNNKSWIVEPQFEYNGKLAGGKLSVMLGGTLQDRISSGSTAAASNYSSDILLGSLAAAGNVMNANSFSQYRYQGLFGRISYNYDDKYILNISGRRDGSSRFGPDSRFSNFMAVGGAWIFSSENWISQGLPWLSFGKLRGSFGTTGNDQIGDYRYLNTWSPSANTYAGNSTLNPTALYNPSFQWERNKKFEIGLDLGFLKDRIAISTSYFHTISDNQLINYTLPTQTGFSSILDNLDATIINKGLEVQISSKNLVGTFTWNTSLNFSLPSNKISEFSNLKNTSYANTYIIGESVSARKVYSYLGVSPQTGIYQFQDVNGDGNFTIADRNALVNTDPKITGGIQNSFSYANIQFDFFFEFRKQNGLNYLNSLAGTVPGYRYFNQPAIVLSRWQKPGDQTNIQRFTAGADGPLTASNLYLRASNAIYSDASFIKLRNVSLSYNFSSELVKKIGMQSVRAYCQGQNLWTITNYEGSDPENQNVFALPPLRTITFGLQFTL